jgi:hypothetical protein
VATVFIVVVSVATFSAFATALGYFAYKHKKRYVLATVKPPYYHAIA